MLNRSAHGYFSEAHRDQQAFTDGVVAWEPCKYTLDVAFPLHDIWSKCEAHISHPTERGVLMSWLVGRCGGRWFFSCLVSMYAWILLPGSVPRWSLSRALLSVVVGARIDLFSIRSKSGDQRLAFAYIYGAASITRNALPCLCYLVALFPNVFLIKPYLLRTSPIILAQGIASARLIASNVLR